jgi:hypothetical protein
VELVDVYLDFVPIKLDAYPLALKANNNNNKDRDDNAALEDDANIEWSQRLLIMEGLSHIAQTMSQNCQLE